MVYSKLDIVTTVGLITQGVKLALKLLVLVHRGLPIAPADTITAVCTMAHRKDIKTFFLKDSILIYF